MSDESLRKAREVLRKQFISQAEAVVGNLPAAKLAGAFEEIIQLRQAIDALDHAIENRWGEGAPAPKALASEYRPAVVEKGINDPDDLEGLPGG